MTDSNPKKGTWSPRSLPLSLLLLVGTTLLLTHCAPLSQNVREASSPPAPKPVEFVYKNSKARKVCVAGSFNQWSDQSHCMDRSGDAWTLNMFLPPGRYEYQFVVNGRDRQPDPEASMAGPSGFGDKAKNSVLIVE